MEQSREPTGIQIKSAATFHTSFKKGLTWFDQHVTPLAKRAIVSNGDRRSFSDGVEAMGAGDVAGWM